MTEYEYDLLVIGSGAAGSTAVTTLDKQNRRIALVERGPIGGTCLNYGCDPTKTLLHIAKVLYLSQHGSKYGSSIPDPKASWLEARDRVQEVIQRLRGGTPDEARANLVRQGIDVLQGEAKFISAHEVSISGKVVSAARILIATGSETMVPKVEGLKEAGYITNVEAVSLPTLPRRMAIAGGGAIGIEFAQLFHRFGVEVTVLERSPQMLDKEDLELAGKLCNILTDEGIRLVTSAELTRVQQNGNCKQLTIRRGEQAEEKLEVDEILMAVGRRPAIESLQLEVAGVKTSKQGILVDATLRTSVQNIWAAGDVASPYQFTHVASEQGKLAVQNAFAEDQQQFDDRVIPWVTYTSPALSHVGKTEEELRQEGLDYRVARASFSGNERAIIEDETEGLVKLLVDSEGNILGGHILGTRADDLLAPIVLAMHANIPVQKLATTILPYPTLSEALRQAASTF